MFLLSGKRERGGKGAGLTAHALLPRFVTSMGGPGLSSARIFRDVPGEQRLPLLPGLRAELSPRPWGDSTPSSVCSATAPSVLGATGSPERWETPLWGELFREDAESAIPSGTEAGPAPRQDAPDAILCSRVVSAQSKCWLKES